MDLFTTVDVIGQGLPLFMPKGTKMIQKLQRWIEDLEDNEWGYVRTRTPLMAKSDLYKISDHWGHYKEGMFILGEDDEDEEGNSISGNDIFALRPMTAHSSIMYTRLVRNLTVICHTAWVRHLPCSVMRIPERCMD